MTLVVCIDTGRGMSFFGRRQSTDSVLQKRIVSMAKGKALVMNAYSASQFRDCGEEIPVTSDAGSAGPDPVVFVEDVDPAPYLDGVDRLVLYRWNRIYPRDMTLNFDPYENGMRLESILDFKGSSHERITEEIWVKRPGAEAENE